VEERYMRIEGVTALVTGANRGLGEQIVKALLQRGAAKVYAGVRNPDSLTEHGAVPLELDITDTESIRAAGDRAGDVTLLVNNAGISTGADVLDGSFDHFRREMDTHVIGMLGLSRAFAPVLARNGGGGLLNVLSALSWYAIPRNAAYCAAKAAAWSVTNSLRVALAEQNTLVSALHVAYMNTDMTAGLEVPKSDPAKIAHIALDGIEAGKHEILADELTAQLKDALSKELSILYPAAS
jgi:NAD(P)-dependent dehydrogenase (short-subunit alcohol dehydrogenase family)